MVPAVAASFLLSCLCCFPGSISFTLAALAAFALIFTVVAVLILICVFVARRWFRAAASIFAGLIAPLLLWAPITWSTECLHLALTVWLGIGQLGSGPPTSQCGVAVYDWSVGFAGGSDTFLIRDAFDEIGLPPQQLKNLAWRENGLGAECAGRTTHLLGHYYICNTE